MNAKSWVTEMATEALKLFGVMIVDFTFCKYGMMSRDNASVGSAKKRTRIMTNSFKSAKQLVKVQRSGDHRHVPLMNFRIGFCFANNMLWRTVMKYVSQSKKNSKIGNVGRNVRRRFECSWP